MRIDLCSNSAASRRLQSVALASVLIVLVSGCANDNLPKPQKLGPLRVLGIIASAPEVAPGGSSTLTPIVSDFDRSTAAGSFRTFTYEWASCEDPGVSLGAEPSCAGKASVTTTPQSQSGTLTGVGTTLTATPFTGKAEAASSYPVTVSAAFLSSKTTFEKYNGVAVLVTLKLTAANGDTVSAFRRILVRDLTVNPEPLNLQPAAATGISSLPGVEQDLTPTVSETAATYTLLSTTGAVLNRTEQLTVSWFTTDGEFEFSRTDGATSNKWTPPSSGTPKALLLLRDDRGGLSEPFTIGF